MAVTADGRVLGPGEAVAVRISGPDWSDLLVHSRIRPFTVEDKQFDTQTLLACSKAGRPGPVFVEKHHSRP